MLNFIKNGIKALPPGRRIRWFFGTGPGIFASDAPMKYSVAVTADGPFGAVERLEYDIDFTALEHSDATTPGKIKDITDQLRKIGTTLDKIEKLNRNRDGQNPASPKIINDSQVDRP